MIRTVFVRYDIDVYIWGSLPSCSASGITYSSNAANLDIVSFCLHWGKGVFPLLNMDLIPSCVISS